ncbi:peptidase S8 [Burkholderia ubonensis]|uniref:S8 family peptidase n=1 Tax=Burkholderia ubonensis TaxID=101571 RepID=UPI0007540285|nr:S8 family peptidase [Burkholderia ubonensis]KVM63420.1 peptidase S8 [Burkholderia ubonensis]KVX84413.1 peptidase S8 [Burkholderia ubonensis]
MTKKNILLGGGEALATESTIERGPNNKNWPYEIYEVRNAVQAPLEFIKQSLASLRSSAKPRQEGVFELILHPAFLGRSYYPSDALRKSGLRDVGSKEVEIVPRKSTKTSRTGKKQATASLFVAGDASSIDRFKELLFADKAPKGVVTDFRKIETVRWITPEEKLRGVMPEGSDTHAFEVALHAGSDEEDIVVAFYNFAKELSATVDLGRRIRVGGLTFLPVTATRDALKALAEFSFLRVARPMSKVREALPNIPRQTVLVPPPTLPKGVALDQSRRVAIFDGGLGTSDLDAWAREVTYEATQTTHGSLLLHGSEVTSTFLFGRPVPGNALPRPYMNVDHFRVLSPTSGRDPDLFDVLHRIKSALETGKYQFANFSIGPRMPIADDEVHAWTATIDQLCARYGIFATVAVGNDGDVDGAKRIQPPSDMVNAMAVGAADSPGPKWGRAPYSCVGPGRSPGFVKPDGVAFGGTSKQPFLVFSPILSSIVGVQGTSYASPLTLRTAAGTAASTAYDMSATALKALMIHWAERRPRAAREEVGWGRFVEDPMRLLECDDESATVIFQGPLAKGQYRRCPIPFPNVVLPGEVTIAATLCIQSHTDPEHSLNYTRSGISVKFRKQLGVGEKAASDFFGFRSQYYLSEREQRDSAHKWETTLHRRKTFEDPVSLADPAFDIEYHARAASRGVPASSAPDLKYALVVSVTAKGVPNVYDLIRQRYPVLVPVQLQVGLDIDTELGT